MNPEHQEVRCKACRTLLAKFDGAGLTVLRGGQQTTIDGTFRARFVCHRPQCRRVLTLRLSTDRP